MGSVGRMTHYKVKKVKVTLLEDDLEGLAFNVHLDNVTHDQASVTFCLKILIDKDERHQEIGVVLYDKID